MITITLLSCKVNSTNKKPDAVIVYEESNEGRPMFNVKLANGRVIEHMYAEEIAQGLLSGQWEYNESMVLVPEVSYQVTLEPDSIHIKDRNRMVAAVSYKQIGILDSIFIKDNE